MLDGLLPSEQISYAGSYGEALSLIDPNPPDILLLDVHLPDRSGVELLRVVRKRYPDTTVIMISNQSDESYRSVCTSLGALRYLPAAVPAVADRWRRAGSPDWSAMPVVIFSEKDDLQHQQLRRHGVEHDIPVTAQVPSTADFYAAIRLGLGWGMVPEPQASAELASGELVRLSADVIDVPLYWQRWRLDSPRLAALTGAVRTAAARHLLRDGDRPDR